jgi:3-phenylpropionate/trans-cinnamate dioxygenase ferredoxin reductase subunit
MTSEQTTTEGPNLEQGVALSELPQGKPFLGQAAGDPVVLVRLGTGVKAIGAACTHYGGPLAEGLVVGDTLRCPWHHACFSLTTGEALGAPALNPVACFRVDVRDGRAYVRGKKESEPLSSHGRRAAGPESVVIIGAGAAGSAAAEMLRREGYGGPITLVDVEAGAPYDRPNLSKDYLAGDAPEEWIPLRPLGFHAEHGIERETSAAATVDVRARTVQLSDGRALPFGALLLATGAVPVRLHVPGSELPHVRVLRSLADSRAIIAAVGSARRVVVLGASFIGMECAASLRSRGAEVTVVAPESVPFQRTLGDEVGRALRATHEAHGVEFRMGLAATRIDPKSVRLSDGSDVPADLVIMGVGVRPDVRVAEGAGLEVENGVLVNDRLQTSAPGVFAAGDIARYPYRGERIRVEHWVAAQRQGQAAARNILGSTAPFVDPPFFWTKQWDFGLRYVGYAAQWTDARVDGDLGARDASIRYFRGDQLLACATVGRDLESLQVEAGMGAEGSERS